MNYTTVAKLKARVKNSLDDESLADIIAEQSALITRTLGVEPGSPVVETYVNQSPGPVLYLTYIPNGIVAVRDLTQDGSPAISGNIFKVQGRALVRNSAPPDWLSETLWTNSDTSARWPTRCDATYAMADSPGVLAICNGACIDLCRLAINDMGVEQSESDGVYSHTSKDIHKERSAILGRVGKIRGIRPVVAR